MKVMVLHPAPLPGRSLDGLPEEVEQAYHEARASAGVGANTGSELMCCKILMHVAADKGAKERQPFEFYVDYLQELGYITPPMRPWVDRIRDRANKATHRLPSTTDEQALMTLTFTEQLLRNVYEMPYLTEQRFGPVERQAS